MPKPTVISKFESIFLEYRPSFTHIYNNFADRCKVLSVVDSEHEQLFNTNIFNTKDN